MNNVAIGILIANLIFGCASTTDPNKEYVILEIVGSRYKIGDTFIDKDAFLSSPQRYLPKGTKRIVFPKEFEIVDFVYIGATLDGAGLEVYYIDSENLEKRIYWNVE